MARHRGTYKPENPEPYELSRSRLEAFLKCPACFWLDRVRGQNLPGRKVCSLGGFYEAINPLRKS